MLSRRLQEISRMLDICDTVADIGSDHGLLPLDMLMNGKINFAVLCDIGAKPLSHAQQHFEAANMTHRAQFFVSDGLLDVDADIKNVIISGMGFETILHIIHQSLDAFQHMDQIILQSNTKVYHVRRFMQEHNFELVNESFVSERGHGYVVLKYKPAQKLQPLKLEHIYFGYYLVNPLQQTYRTYLEKELKRHHDLLHTNNPEILIKKDILIDILHSK